MSTALPSSVASASASPSASLTAFESVIAWGEKWFETSPYASWVPTILGALGIAFRLWMTQRTVKKVQKNVDAKNKKATIAPSTMAPAASSEAASSSTTTATQSKGATSKRKGKQ